MDKLDFLETLHDAYLLLGKDDRTLKDGVGSGFVNERETALESIVGLNKAVSLLREKDRNYFNFVNMANELASRYVNSFPDRSLSDDIDELRREGEAYGYFDLSSD